MMNLRETIKKILGENIVNGEFYEATTSHYRKFYDEDEVNRFEKILNKSMKKYDWWKDIKIDMLTYDERTKRLNISAVLSVDEEWAAQQWMDLYYTKVFDPQNHTLLGDTIDEKLGYSLRDDISNIFEFAFGNTVDSFSLGSTLLKVIPTQDIQENVEEKSKKDLSPMIRESLNNIIEIHKDIVCDIEITAPWNRETIEPHNSFKHYKVLITFIGGYGTEYFPVTQSVRKRYDDIIDEIWQTAYSFFGQPTDIYMKTTKECNQTYKEEQTEGEITERCWKGYTQKGMKTMFGKRYPNCVKKTK